MKHLSFTLLLLACSSLYASAVNETRFFILQNMPGPNEIKCVALMDSCFDVTYASCGNAIFAGTVVQNNKKKIMLGRYSGNDSTLIWLKAIEVDSLMDVFGLQQTKLSSPDTSFIVCFNAWDINTNMSKIGAIRFNKHGQVSWTNYYTSDSSLLIGNSSGYAHYNYPSYNIFSVVGRADYQTSSKALRINIYDSAGTPTLATELTIDNSLFQQYEWFDKSTRRPGEACYEETAQPTGFYYNPATGLDWFQVGTPFMGLATMELPGHQRQVFNTLLMDQSCGGSLTHQSIYFKTDSNKIQTISQNNNGTWQPLRTLITYPHPVEFKKLFNPRTAFYAKLFLTKDQGNNSASTFFTTSINNTTDGKNYIVPNTDFEINDIMGMDTWNFTINRNVVGSMKNNLMPFKNSIIGDIVMGAMSCVTELNQQNYSTTPSNVITKPHVFQNVNIYTAPVTYTVSNIQATLERLCGIAPILQNAVNFTNPIPCGTNTVKVKVANPPAGVPVLAQLNGNPVPYNPADSTIDLSGLLSPLSDTLIVMFQGGITFTATDTIFQLSALPAINYTVSPANAIVCNPGIAELNATGPDTYTWTGGIQNGVPFQPLVTTVYTLTATDASGCTNTATQLITVNTVNLNIVVLPANATVCAGEYVSLTATGAVSYQWSGGVQNAISFIPSVTNTYTVTGTIAGGCSASATQTVTVHPIIAPALSISGSIAQGPVGTPVTYTALSNVAPPFSINWYLNNNWAANTAVNTWNTTLVAGPNQVKATLSAPAQCLDPDSVTSNTVTVLIVSGIDHDPAEAALKIYPNPVSELLHIEGIQWQDELRLMDMQGKEIWSDVVPQGIRSVYPINIARFAAGAYQLQIIRDGRKFIRRWVKE